MDTRRVRPPRPDAGRDARETRDEGPRGAAGPVTPGEILRTARLKRRLSLAEAEQATRIRQRYLQALEDDDYSVLPKGVYSVGFLRNYAIFLGVPPEEVLGGGDSRRRRERGPSLQSVAPPIQLSSPRTMWLFFAGGVVALLLLALAWLGLSDPNPPSQASARPTAAPGSSPTSVVSLQPLAPAATATSAPTPQPTVGPTSTPAATANPRQVEVELRAVDRAWVRATIDGEVAWEQTLESGQTRRVVGQQSVELRVGNGAGVEVTANGQRIGTLGPSGQPVDRRFTR
ncbi:MAG TPA: RodZ domain-containing protein [Chloroflexota bacterium]|nr:RodZ domain-containing protein [Chloroflexota bacterium]